MFPGNNLTLIGNLVSNPEVRNVGENRVCNFSIARQKAFKNEETDYFNCVAWNKNAENIEKYFVKGDRIGIVGYLSTRTWKDEATGKNRSVIDIIVTGIDMTLKRKKDGETTSYDRRQKSFDTPTADREEPKNVDIDGEDDINIDTEDDDSLPF